jgi:hypothetical protein
MGQGEDTTAVLTVNPSFAPAPIMAIVVTYNKNGAHEIPWML